MIDWYELIGQTAVPMHGDVLEWALKYETMDRRVAETTLFGMCRVSTIFLSLDHSWNGGRPLLFETMAFWPGRDGYEQERCSTWLEAQEQHARMCAEVARPAAVAAYIRRRLSDRWYQAKTDLERRWREIRGIEPTEMEQTMLAMEARMADRQEGW
jgi:hypothetical protein